MQSGPTTTKLSTSTVLTFDQWQPLALKHYERVDQLTEEARARKVLGIRHPIEDFLWEYYSLRPNHLRRWHPGWNVEIQDAPEYESLRGYTLTGTTASVSAEFVERRRESLMWMLQLMESVSQREPKFGCFGLHEWAMVYQLDQSEVRHESAPLRLSTKEIAEVVEAAQLKCTHYDAFRFYVPKARTLNHMVLERTDQLSNEQGGCLHANMDLYKWAYKALPIVSSELTLRCFELAREIRTLDMQAAPYDLTQWDLQPVKIETTEGRAEYVKRQRDFAAKAQSLRTELGLQLRTALFN